MMYLMWNVCDLSHGHWLNVKSKMNGVSGVLEEVENEFWGYVPSEGPFERREEDSRRWADYVNAKKTVVTKTISNMQSRLLEVEEKMDSLYKDNNRKEPAIDMNQTKGTSFGSLSTLRDSSKTLKLYLQVLRNWVAYLEDLKIRWREGIPVEEIQRMMNELESRKETVDRGDVLKISLLLKNLRQNLEARKDDSNATCNEADTKIGNVLRQVQKNFSETFLYKNITLAEINQMSRIVDFVERYRGRVEKIPGLESRKNTAGSGMQKKLRLVEATED